MIVVTGMHRSGTSLVSMVLDEFGLDFGDHSELYAVDQWNEEGYFERRDVVDLSSRLITGFNRTPSRLASGLSQVGYLLWSSERSMAGRASDLAHEISGLTSVLGDLAVKDPRFCLTLPVWLHAVDDCVVCLRPAIRGRVVARASPAHPSIDRFPILESTRPRTPRVCARTEPLSGLHRTDRTRTDD